MNYAQAALCVVVVTTPFDSYTAIGPFGLGVKDTGSGIRYRVDIIGLTLFAWHEVDSVVTSRCIRKYTTLDLFSLLEVFPINAPSFTEVPSHLVRKHAPFH